MVVFIYPCKKRTPMWIVFKLFLYILLASTIVFSIHSNFIRNNYKEKYNTSNINNIIQNPHNGTVYGGESVTIKPNLNYQKEPTFDPDLLKSIDPANSYNYTNRDTSSTIDSLLTEVENQI